jgi:hypothetical protein
MHFMPITQGWDNPEKTIYRIDINEQWTWDDFDRAIDEGNRMMATQAPTKVDLILCINTLLPPGNAITHLRQQEAPNHRIPIALLL